MSEEHMTNQNGESRWMIATNMKVLEGPKMDQIT